MSTINRPLVSQATLLSFIKSSDAFELCSNLKPVSVKNYMADMALLSGWLDSIDIAPDNITQQDLETFLAEQKTLGYGISTIHRRSNAIRSILGRLCKAGLLADNPAQNLNATRIVGSIKDDQVSIRPLTAAEATAFFAQIPTETNKGLRDRALYITTLFAAMAKPGEASILRFEDYRETESGPVLRIGEGKRREVPLDQEAAKNMKRHFEANKIEDGFVFRSARKKQASRSGAISGRSMRRNFELYARKANIDPSQPDVALSSLRTLAIVRKIAAGEALKDVAAQAGFLSITSLDPYQTFAFNPAYASPIEVKVHVNGEAVPAQIEESTDPERVRATVLPVSERTL